MVIIAAVDRSDRAEAVVNESEALSKAFDEPVHVVHVLSRSEFIEIGMTSAEEGESVNMDQIRRAAADIAADAAADLTVPSEAVGLMGDPESRINDYAADRNARYIVVAGRKRSPAGKAIFGSVTQSILLNAECPVVSTISQVD